jgi:hypothetical protein
MDIESSIYFTEIISEVTNKHDKPFMAVNNDPYNMVDVSIYTSMYIDESRYVVIKGGGPETTRSEGTHHPGDLDRKMRIRLSRKETGNMYD